MTKPSSHGSTHQHPGLPQLPGGLPLAPALAACPDPIAMRVCKWPLHWLLQLRLWWSSTSSGHHCGLLDLVAGPGGATEDPPPPALLAAADSLLCLPRTTCLWICKEKVAGHVSNRGRDLNIQVRKARRSPKKVNLKRSSLRLKCGKEKKKLPTKNTLPGKAVLHGRAINLHFLNGSVPQTFWICVLSSSLHIIC